MTDQRLQRRLVTIASAPYRNCGRYAYYFARGKLRRDPVFATLLERGMIPDGARILDLGCGQGLLAAWLDAAQVCYRAGDWLDAWPVPPTCASIRGIELMPRTAACAQRALGARARIEVGDIRTADFGEADVVVILDVLHYIDHATQERVLRNARAALRASGRLLLRVADAEGGLRFQASRWVDVAVELVRGGGRRGLQFRGLAAWSAALSGAGFRSVSIPMSRGTPFANVLLVATPQ